MTRRSNGSMAALLEELQLREGSRSLGANAAELRASPMTQSQFDTDDHMVSRDGMHFAGTHLILDMWDASNLSDADVVEAALRQAAEDAGATLLSVNLHRFTPNGGITGVAVLAESHISIHTWPERAYAAVDVFMCGDAEPYKAIDILRGALKPKLMTLSEHRRGVMS